MTTDPSADEILAAIGHWLGTLADPASSFDTYFGRIATNALGIVRREVALGPAADRDEAARLAALLDRGGSLGELNAALCTGLRQGTIDAAAPGLIAHLKETALRQIAIDQPDYRSPPVRPDNSGGQDE